jgi:hypothetical protein
MGVDIMVDAQASWDDTSWLEKSDNSWQRRLRRHQGWWREKHTNLPAGPRTKSDDRLVVSMLPDRGTSRPNLLTQEAQEAAEKAISRLNNEGGPGLIASDRLERNLLSSQPLCFNLFGHLRMDPTALLPWIQAIRPGAVEVARVELEIAPVRTPLTRSAFDAYVEYSIDGRGRGFFGIECKYAEDLAAAQRDPAADKVKVATTSPPWRPDAVAELDRPGHRQFWYNTLLTQLTLKEGEFDEGVSVVVALSEDAKAKAATEAVSAELQEPSTLVFSSIEDVVDKVAGHDDWKRDFRTRYLDLHLSEQG